MLPNVWYLSSRFLLQQMITEPVSVIIPPAGMFDCGYILHNRTFNRLTGAMYPIRNSDGVDMLSCSHVHCPPRIDL